MKPKPVQTADYDQECDEAIWSTFQLGNRDAFAALYHRYFKILVKNGLRISSDKDLVKDCIHDLFMEIWKNKLNLATPASVKAYLISSIHRKVIRQVKRMRTREKEIHHLSVHEFAHSKEDQIISQQRQEEQQHKINKALCALTKRQKEVVYLKFYANLSYAEIANLMAISTESIYNLVSKAIDNLQGELTKMPEHKFQ
ncbi:RNA polymerase sigma factor [Chryseolinea lacunae]|uniref:Sigma-70 family RNA polymerase sigma factor n=1 Tax=Chryseolinea lacunae TaxID=2801331 RepID=A0ABS1L2X8_9BACT|nr:sigma-70 family RNA polymerase sigma factor [Chryseolinea lacunae]MBL0745297.1 sigma-70 family RNA polymerase sigma factor [Chryseolinea lacunae]